MLGGKFPLQKNIGRPRLVLVPSAFHRNLSMAPTRAASRKSWPWLQVAKIHESFFYPKKNLTVVEDLGAYGADTISTELLNKPSLTRWLDDWETSNLPFTKKTGDVPSSCHSPLKQTLEYERCFTDIEFWDTFYRGLLTKTWPFFIE